MEAVQRPIIPVVAELIRQHPGTISLGQGVVHYGPPREATDRLGRFLADPENHKYKSVEGIAELVARIEAKLAAENGIIAGGAADIASRVVVTAGGNMAFFNALLAIADPGDEIILLAPYYFNHEMAVAMLNCRAVVVPLDSNYQIDLRSGRAPPSPAARGRSLRSRRTTPPAPSIRERRWWRSTSCAGGGGIYHISDEAYEYFVYDGAEHFSPGSLTGRGRAHDLALFVVEGLWHGQLAGRLHGDSRGADRGSSQGAGHDPDLPTGDVAAGRRRRAGGGPRLLPAADRRVAQVRKHGARRADGRAVVLHDSAGPGGVLFPVAASTRRWTT